MTSVNNMTEAEELLAKYVPLTANITGKDITVGRTLDLLNALGDPQKKLKIIHVAGTSGKTSTSYYIANLLKSTGRKVGLSVSPHIDTVRERIQINMQPVSETEFVNSLNEFIGKVEDSKIEPTYFELLVAFAYWYFDRQRVDYAVMETGMGGLNDGTNAASQPDKVCVITDIGLDHMHVLGRTVPEIARQKAGIIHEGNIVFIHSQSEEVINVIKDYADDKNAELRIIPDSSGEDKITDKLPNFQRRNWSLATAVIDYVKERDNLPEPILVNAMDIQVPGRMDAAKVEGKTIIMDGAHNEQKTEAFVGSLQENYPNHKMPVLLSLKRGKEFAAVLSLLRPVTSKLIITEYQTSQDLPVASFDSAELATAAKKFGFDDVVTEPDKDKAYQMLLNEPGSLGVITGSFYLIGQLRQNNVELKHG